MKVHEYLNNDASTESRLHYLNPPTPKTFSFSSNSRSSERVLRAYPLSNIHHGALVRTHHRNFTGVNSHHKWQAHIPLTCHLLTLISMLPLKWLSQFTLLCFRGSRGHRGMLKSKTAVCLLNHFGHYKTRKLWDSCPQSVKSFPWSIALEDFIQLILDLILAVAKYLCVPLLAISSLSEMSYCAHERKLCLVPVPVLIGIAVAWVLGETALDLAPLLKDAEVPWHLITIATFFTFLKLLGPYYPYWGRIFIPHFANGGLWRTLWFAFLWYRKPQKESTTTLQENSGNGTRSEPNKLQL